MTKSRLLAILVLVFSSAAFAAQDSRLDKCATQVTRALSAGEIDEVTALFAIPNSSPKEDLTSVRAGIAGILTALGGITDVLPLPRSPNGQTLAYRIKESSTSPTFEFAQQAFLATTKRYGYVVLLVDMRIDPPLCSLRAIAVHFSDTAAAPPADLVRAMETVRKTSANGG